MIIAIPHDDDLCVAPELAILTALETSLAIAAQVLNIAHTEILAPGHDRHDPCLDTRVAAEIIAEAAHMIATRPRPMDQRRAGDVRVRVHDEAIGGTANRVAGVSEGHVDAHCGRRIFDVHRRRRAGWQADACGSRSLAVRKLGGQSAANIREFLGEPGQQR